MKAKKTSSLVELVDKYRRCKAKKKSAGGSESDDSDEDSDLLV